MDKDHECYKSCFLLAMPINHTYSSKVHAVITIHVHTCKINMPMPFHRCEWGMCSMSSTFVCTTLCNHGVKRVLLDYNIILKFDVNFGMCTTIGTTGKDNMSVRLPVYSREYYLSRLDHKLRVSVRCMCLISA